MIFLLFFGLLVFVVFALLVVLSTVGLTLGSLVTLLTAPAQLGSLLGSRQVRRNHALEHATINVIEERFGPSRLAGQTDEEGFAIRGGVSPQVVAEAAAEALERLRAGERRLAIHPRCGTTLLASQLVLAVGVLALLLAFHALSPLPFLAGIVAAALLGPRLSPLLQRWVTTDANVGTLSLRTVEVRPPAGRFGLLSLLMFTPVYVRTRDAVSSSTSPSDVAPGAGEPWEIPTRDYRIR